MSSAATTETRTTWNIDPAHSGVHFSIKHLVVATVRGQFDKVSGSVVIDPVDPAGSSVHAVIDAASIDTREPQRDAHLRSPDFLDVARFPTIEFRSTDVARTHEGYAVTGDLTIHGVTRPVVLMVETADDEIRDHMGNVKRAATARTKLSRKDFGLTWNVALETGGFVVGDEIRIEIDVELLHEG
ncbi:MAG TPA: YceI family protein [Gemmatimonadales bacterium]|nr:YceI family protein [Gemmatimonadales bacterium]